VGSTRRQHKSLQETQLALLLQRQAHFKAAALEAKKKGEIEEAKEFLRNCKGLNGVIEASRGGLPVNMATVPVPPQEQAAGGGLTRQVSVDAAWEVISGEAPGTGVEMGVEADLAVLYQKIEDDLIAQIKMCATTRQHFKSLGDVASANRFEQLILHSKKDLDAVRLGARRGDKPPRCHYENRCFSIVQCNTDLNDSDCEVTVIRGINYNASNPADVDTFVKTEFPYPSDNCPVDRGEVVKDTNNPEYEHKIVFSIDRKTRALARVFRRQSVKVSVYMKGGWFQRSSVFGFAKIPLLPLETTCTVHDSFDLVDDRKKMVGGKVEVKIRVRNPIVSKEIKQVNEKWLVIDGW